MTVVARLAGAFGVRGEVRFVSLTTDPDAVFDYKTFFREDGTPLQVSHHRLLKDNVYAVKLHGIDTRTAAEQLPKCALHVPRDAMPALTDDDFYYIDLIGLSVYTTNDQHVGTVKSVCNYGGGDLLVVIPLPQKDDVLIPFTKHHVPTVSLADHKIHVLAQTWDDFTSSE